MNHITEWGKDYPKKKREGEFWPTGSEGEEDEDCVEAKHDQHSAKTHMETDCVCCRCTVADLLNVSPVASPSDLISAKDSQAGYVQKLKNQRLMLLKKQGKKD